MLTPPLRSQRNRTSARRTARGAAALFALVLVASNALAAMGLCVVKAPPPAAVTQAAEVPCPHDVDTAGVIPSGEPAAAAHCPQDDPAAQTRAGDVPSACVVAVPVFLRFSVATDSGTQRAAIAADSSPPTPLYARLSRLLL
jgi:hypothetical protein